jgi:hypothetical protein
VRNHGRKQKEQEASRVCEGTLANFQPSPAHNNVCAGDGDDTCTDAHSLPALHQRATITITISRIDCDDCDICADCSGHDHHGAVFKVAGVVQTIFGTLSASSACLQLFIGDEK